MAEQNNTGNTRARVYKYGLVPLEPFPKEAVTELLKANILWNKLVGLHYDNHEQYEKLCCDASHKYKSLKDQIDEKKKEIEKAYEEKRESRMKAGTTESKNPFIGHANCKIKKLKEERRKLYGETKIIREQIKKEKLFEKDFEELSRKFRDECKTAVRVKNTGLQDSPVGLGGTHANQILRDFQAARKKLFADWKLGIQAQLRYHKFDGTGYFYYRFRRPQKKRDGFSFHELDAKQNDGRDFTIKLLTALNRRGKNTGKPKKEPRYELRAKLGGGNQKANKFYCKFVLILHRSLPANAQIQNAQIIRNRVGNRFSYSVCFTVRESAPKSVKSKTAVGIDLNWREDKQKKTIEVATIAHEDGSPAQTIALPETIIEKEDYINEKKSKMDASSTELGKEIKKYIKTMKLPDDHGKKKLWNSVVKLPDNRTLSFETAFKVAGWATYEPGIFPKDARKLLSEWRVKHGRTYQECHNLRHKILGHRKDFYRQKAAGLVKTAKEIVLEEIDLSELAKYRDRDDTLSKKARRNRVLAAPGEFRSIIEGTAKREGFRFIIVTRITPLKGVRSVKK